MIRLGLRDLYVSLAQRAIRRALRRETSVRDGLRDALMWGRLAADTPADAWLPDGVRTVELDGGQA